MRLVGAAASGARERGATAPRSRAAFSRASIDDAKRGYPATDLSGYADRRGLEWMGEMTPAGYRAVVPGKPETQSNVMRGVLPGGEYGVMAHEGLEIPFSADSLDWGGTFYGLRVVAGGVGLRGMLPFSGRTNTALVRVPCTVAGARVPETAGTQTSLRIDTRRSAPPFTASNRVKLDSRVGEKGWSVWGVPKLDPRLIDSLLEGPVTELLRAHSRDGLFQIVVWWGTLVVRRDGYLGGADDLDALAQAAGLLAGRLREACRALADPQPLGVELPPPVWHLPGDPAAVFNPEQMWGRWATATAARYGLTLEDPLSFHRAFPAVPIPGQARLVFRGALPELGDGRLVIGRERDASRPAILLGARPGVPDTPPGGTLHADLGVRVEVRDGMHAVWATGSYWGSAMAGDLDQFLTAAATAIGRG